MNLLINLILIIGLVVIGMLLRLAEISVPHAPESEISELSQKGNRAAIRVLKMKDNVAGYIFSLKTAVSASEFISSALAVLYFSPIISGRLVLLKIPSPLSKVISILAVSFLYIFFAVLLIALVARHIALKSPLKIALGVSGFAYTVSKIFKPLSKLIAICAKALLKLMGINPDEQDGRTATEAAIKSLADTGSEYGMIADEEKEFIENVFAFNDLNVDEIATHRKEITLLWTNETDSEWEKTVLQSHHSDFPICDEKIDNIVGILSAKEYLRLKDRSRQNVMKHAVKPPYYIPETMKADIALKNMKQKRRYFAVVIDEYGGLSGILTVTDLLQCIVGEIYEDECAEQVPDIEPLDSKTWRILGQTEIADVEDALGITLDGDFDTFAGYVLTMVDAIPDDDVTFTVENEIMTVKITAIKNHRILKTVVKLKEPSIDGE